MIAARVDANEMRRLYGEGPACRCEQCLNLQPTAEQRPNYSRSDPLTTFTCVVAQRRGRAASWSLLWPACGRFLEASE